MTKATQEDDPGAALLSLVPSLADENNHAAIESGVALCSNPETPLSAIQSVMGEPEVCRAFRRTVARETSRTDVLELLAQDRSGKVRKQALMRLSPRSL